MGALLAIRALAEMRALLAIRALAEIRDLAVVVNQHPRLCFNRRAALLAKSWRVPSLTWVIRAARVALRGTPALRGKPGKAAAGRAAPDKAVLGKRAPERAARPIAAVQAVQAARPTLLVR
jgi:hypothetical protein